MRDVFFADAIVLREEERERDDDDLILFEGTRRLRIEAEEAAILIDDVDDLDDDDDGHDDDRGGFPRVIDPATGRGIDYDEVEVFEITLDGAAGQRVTSYYLNFYDSDGSGDGGGDDDPEFDYLVRIEGPGVPLPAPGADFARFIEGFDPVIRGSDDDGADRLTGRFAEGRSVEYQDIQGLTLEGGGLTIGEAGLVALLYEAGLDRDGRIDETGLNFWIDRREAGLTEKALARRFLESEEFREAFGEALDEDGPGYLSDEALVRQLYRNVLEREGERGGVDFWTDRLADGIGRDDLLLAFADSTENRQGVDFLDRLVETEEGLWSL